MEKQEINYPVDHNGRKVKLGDKIKGFGELVCQDGFKIDRTSIVTANIQNGVLYFGNLSASSFSGGFVIVEPKQEAKTATLIMLDKPILVNEEEVMPNNKVFSSVTNKVCVFADPRHFSDGTFKKVIAGHEGTKRLTFNLSEEDAKRIGYVDMEKLAEEKCPIFSGESENTNRLAINLISKDCFKKGIELGLSLTPKKYTDRDVTNIYRMAKRGIDFDLMMQELNKPKQFKPEYTETETEIIVTKIL